jgi:hypothetical protein
VLSNDYARNNEADLFDILRVGLDKNTSLSIAMNISPLSKSVNLKKKKS